MVLQVVLSLTEVLVFTVGLQVDKHDIYERFFLRLYLFQATTQIRVVLLLFSRCPDDLHVQYLVPFSSMVVVLLFLYLLKLVFLILTVHF